WRQKKRDGHLRIAYQDSTPTSPSCSDFGLPTHTTLQRTELSGSSSSTISTFCPRFSGKLTRSRNPSFEESRTRHGSLFGLRAKSNTRLARCFACTRCERRVLGPENAGTCAPPVLR